jgi:hypothetical protein
VIGCPSGIQIAIRNMAAREGGRWCLEARSVFDVHEVPRLTHFPKTHRSD